MRYCSALKSETRDSAIVAIFASEGPTMIVCAESEWQVAQRPLSENNILPRPSGVFKSGVAVGVGDGVLLEQATNPNNKIDMIMKFNFKFNTPNLDKPAL